MTVSRTLGVPAIGIVAAAGLSAAPLHARPADATTDTTQEVSADPDAMCFVGTAFVSMMAQSKSDTMSDGARRRAQLMRLALPYYAGRLAERVRDDDALEAKLATARAAFKQADRKKVAVDCFDDYKAGMQRVAGALKTGATAEGGSDSR